MNTKRLIPFVLIVIVIILLNVASTTLFVRGDLTRNNVYSLSDASKDAVATLEEPLTIKAFFSPNLPAPYNNNQQILRDLLDEYAIAGNQFFNYDIVTVPSRESGETSPEEEEARRYRIFPIQIQNVQQDEVQLVTAFMGLAIIHGDMLETIPAITSTANLEYRVTSLIDDMSAKISALLAMRENIDVTLILTENLNRYNDAMRTLPAEIEAAVDELNSEYYGRLSYQHIDPSTRNATDVETIYGAAQLSLRNEDGSTEPAYATVSISRGERNYAVDIISRGIFGMQIADVASLSETIAGVADSLIGVQEEIGVVTGFGAPPLEGLGQQGAASSATDLANFNAVVSSEYRFRQIDIETDGIPDGLRTLLIISPTDRLSDYALYQIDQYLLQGNNVVLFLDSHTIIYGQQSQFGGQEPVYVPRNTGLEELIAHYGLELERAYALDEQSFVQRQRNAQGSIVETDVYFAPIISENGRNTNLAFLRGIPDMVLVNASPVRMASPADGGDDAPNPNAVTLITTTEDGWTMEGENINLSNPFMLTPPPDEDQSEIPLAAMIDDEFESFFAGREIPDRPAPEGDGDSGDGAADNEIHDDSLDVQATRVDSGRGRLIVIGGSAMIGSNVIDAEGQTGNAAFVLNLFDFLAGREDYAIMRTKGASFDALEDTTPAVRSFVKTFNIAGLPIIVILIGVGVWMIRNTRKRQIETRFSHLKEDA